MALALVVLSIAGKCFGQLPNALDTSHSPDRPNAIGSYLLPQQGTAFLIPQYARLSYEHLQGLSRWQAHFQIDSATTSIPKSFDSLRRFSYGINLDALSRYREEDRNLTTESAGLISGSFAPYPLQKWLLFVSFMGTSYISNTPVGSIPSPILITHATDGYGIAGAKVQLPGTDVSISAGAGIARQTQPTASGIGSIVRGDIIAPGESIADASMLNGLASIDERFFAQRNQRYSNDSARIHTVTAFGTSDSPTTPKGHNDALLILGLLRRDFFYPIDSVSAPVKQERREMSFLLCDTLSYPLVAEHINGSIDGTVEPRSVVRSSDATSDLVSNHAFSGLSSLLAPNQISGLRLSTGVRLDLLNLFAPTNAPSSTGLSGQATARFEEKDENVALLSAQLQGLDQASVKQIAETLDEASYAARTTTAGIVLRYAPDLFNSYEAESDARLFSYDTPNPQNHDDRDELQASARIAYHRTFADNLQAGLELRGSRNHLVYLASDHSAQNSVTRGLALASDGSFASDNLYQSLRAEVFSNYTVLDYLNEFPLLSSVGSYVLRGISFRDSTRIELGLHPVHESNLSFESNFEIRDYERGEWQESSFSERRSATNLEIAGEAVFTLSVHEGNAPWSARLGTKGFLLSRSALNQTALTPAGTYEEIERQSRIGPLFECSLYRAGTTGPTLTASVWYALLAVHNFETDTWTHDRSVESLLAVRWSF